MYPYYRYIRVLSLRDLAALLDDSVFRERYSRGFFSGELADLAVETKGHGRPNLRSRTFDIAATIGKVGDQLIEQTPMIEELDCNETSPESLNRWIPQLKRLQQLRLWNGTALIGTGSLLRIHCPDFTTLKFYIWPNEDTDSQFAAFLTELHPKPLRSLEIFGSSNASSAVISSLSSFSPYLAELKFGAIQDELLASLPLLGACPCLTTLHLETRIREAAIPKKTQTAIANWLTDCTSLTDIRFINDNNSLIPLLFTPLLLHPTIHLTNLELTRYDAALARGFHSALSSQSSSLRSLILKANGETCDCDQLVQHLCRLTRLKDLHLFHVSDFFNDNQIKTLADSMPELEGLVVSGWNITDAIWPSLSSLSHLRRLDLNAFSAFTLDGILDYITALGPGNQGLALAIMMADPDHALSEAAQRLARESLSEKVEGRFDYTLARGRHAFEYRGVGEEMRIMLLLGCHRFLVIDF